MDRSAPPSVEKAALLEPVRRALGCANPEIVGWEVKTLQPAVPEANAGVYWVRGSARMDGALTPWSVVLKALRPPGKREDPSMADFYDGDPALEPTSLLFWKREALAYQSGLLDDLPGGLAAPRWLGSEARGDEMWLWLEEIADSSAACWSLDDYAHAAYVLGRFNGAYLADRPIPSAPWLARDWLRRFVWRAAPAIDRLPRLLDNPVIGRWLRSDVAASLFHIWQERDALLDALDRLPQTFCHHDAHRGNLFVRNLEPGNDELVAIDWAGMGAGPVGEELGLLVGVAVYFGVAPLDRACELEDRALARYIEGLRDAGWREDARMVRLGYMASIALKLVIGYLPGMLWYWRDESTAALYEQMVGESVGIFADRWADATSWTLDRGVQALGLLRGAR